MIGWLGYVLSFVFGLGAVMIYIFFYKSRLIPRWLSSWGQMVTPTRPHNPWFYYHEAKSRASSRPRPKIKHGLKRKKQLNNV